MERTIVIIKPDGIEKKVVGEIIARIECMDLAVGQIRRKKISRAECRKLYPTTRVKKPKIYAAVEKYMTENFSIILTAEGKDAVRKVRNLRGPTDLLSAPEGTVRRDFVTAEERELFGQEKYVKNVMHAPDDKEEAEFEIRMFFKGE